MVFQFKWNVLFNLFKAVSVVFVVNNLEKQSIKLTQSDLFLSIMDSICVVIWVVDTLYVWFRVVQVVQKVEDCWWNQERHDHHYVYCSSKDLVIFKMTFIKPNMTWNRWTYILWRLDRLKQFEERLHVLLHRHFVMLIVLRHFF